MKKVDVMGPVTATADRLGLSVRQMTMFAASVVNSIGLDLDKTNVSKSNAWKVSRKKRLKITESVKDEFLCPDNTILHYVARYSA